MDILFENTYIRDAEMVKEMYKYFYFKRPLKIVLFVLLGAVFAFDVFLMILTGEVMWVVIIAVVVCAFLQFYLYNYQVKLLLKRDKETQGTTPKITVTVMNDCIQGTATNGAVQKLDYDKIKGVVQTKNLIMIRSEARLLYILKKDGFTKGSTDEFLKFMKNKGIKVK